MNLGGTRPLGGIRGWSEGIGGSLRVGSGGNTSPGGILGEFRGTRSPGELEEGLKEHRVPWRCVQVPRGKPDRAQVTDRCLEQVGDAEGGFSGGDVLGQAGPGRDWGCPGRMGAGSPREDGCAHHGVPEGAAREEGQARARLRAHGGGGAPFPGLRRRRLHGNRGAAQCAGAGRNTHAH